MKTSIGVLGCVVALQAGCGLAAGDIEVYRVAISAATVTGDCEEEYDEDTFGTSAVWSIMAHDVSGDTVYLLDTGGQVLTGIETDNGYTFNARRELGETLDEDLDLKVRFTTDETVTVSADGSQMSGDYTRLTTTKCTGDSDACDVFGFDDAKCTFKANFVGIHANEEVEVVEPPSESVEE